MSIEKEILSLLYYSFTGKNYLFAGFISTELQENLIRAKESFEKSFYRQTGETFSQMLGSLKKPVCTPEISENEEKGAKLFELVFENQFDRETMNKALLQFWISFEYGLAFLYYWNLRFEIFPDLLPKMPNINEIKHYSAEKNPTIIGIGGGTLSQAASTRVKNYPIHYGVLMITMFGGGGEGWKIHFTEISEDCVRILVESKTGLQNRNIRLVLENNEKTYLLANLSEMEAQSIREFEINTNQIPLQPWKINHKDFHHQIYIEEIK